MEVRLSENVYSALAVSNPSKLFIQRTDRCLNKLRNVSNFLKNMSENGENFSKEFIFLIVNKDSNNQTQENVNAYLMFKYMHRGKNKDSI